MATYATDIHGPAGQLPATTGKVARCKVCHTEWQVRGPSDVKGCAFCGANSEAIKQISEKPTYGGAIHIT